MPTYLSLIRRGLLALLLASTLHANDAVQSCKVLVARLDPAFAKHTQERLIAAEANLREQENGVEGGRAPRNSVEARQIQLLELYRELHNLAQVHAANEKVMHEDADYREMAEAENAQIEKTIRSLSGTIKKQVLEKLDPGPAPDAPLIIELKSDGSGHDGEMFVKFMAQNYLALAKTNGVTLETASQEYGTRGSQTGLTSITFLAKGKEAYCLFRREGGVHVMIANALDGKKDGRAYTNAIRISVTPEITLKNAENIPESEFTIQATRSSGPGGQNVNKVESAIRVTHKATGIMVFIQTERDQIRNKETALRICRSRVAAQYNETQQADLLAAKRAQMGSGATGDRARTYNLISNQVIDARTGQRVSWTDFQEGKLPPEFREALDDDRLIELSAVAPPEFFTLPPAPRR